MVYRTSLPSLPLGALVALLVGCADSAPIVQPPVAGPPPGPSVPAWLGLRVDTVTVAPTRSDGRTTWDGPEPRATNDGALCALVGIAGGLLVSPIGGKGAEVLCRALETKPRQQQQDPTLPDLFVMLYAGPQ